MTFASNRLRLLVLCIGVAVAVLSAGAALASCNPDPDGVLVCGAGDAAMRVIADTTSPEKRFAIAWRERDTPGSEEPNADNVENLLVRLSDGKVLLTLGGNFWSTGKLRANRRDEIVLWSGDGRFMVEIANDRWDTFSLRAAKLDGENVTGNADLLPLVEKETRTLRQRRKGSPPDGALSFRIDADEPPRLSNNGELFLRALLFVPKREDGQTAVDLHIKLAGKAGGLAPRLISARRVRD